MRIAAGATVLAGESGTCVDGPRGLVVTTTDVDDVQPVVGGARPVVHRRGNRTVRVGFSVRYEHGSVDAAALSVLGRASQFAGQTVTVTFADLAGGTLLTLERCLINAQSRQEGVAELCEWSIAGTLVPA